MNQPIVSRTPTASTGVEDARAFELKGVSMDIKRVAIIGRGAVGLLYGSVIAERLGQDSVTYVMDDARYERHRGEHITINGEPLALTTVPASKATQTDLVIVATKATGLEQALDTMEALVGPDTCIISLINGIRSEQRIAERFGWQHTVLAIAQGMDAVFLDGGLTFTHTGEIRFGAAEESLPEVVPALDAFFARAGVPHVVEQDIWHRLWTKLMLNAGINQTCMAYGCDYGAASRPGEENRCFVAAMREVLAVGRAEGISLTERDLAEMAALIASLDPAGLPSMAQDRINHKPTEVDEFAGTVVALARKHGILVPQNEWLYGRIRDIEQSW